MSEIPQFNHDATMFERELVTKFHLDRNVRILLEGKTPDEPFVTTLERTGRRVIEIMRQHDLYQLASPDEYVTNGASFDSEYGWVYHVRTQKREE